MPDMDFSLSKEGLPVCKTGDEAVRDTFFALMYKFMGETALFAGEDIDLSTGIGYSGVYGN